MPTKECQMTNAQVMLAFAAFPRFEVIPPFPSDTVALSSSASVSRRTLSMGHTQINWVRYRDEGGVERTIKLL